MPERIFWLVFLLLSAGWSRADAAENYCASGKTIVFAGINWPSGELITAVLREILAKGYGCRTDSIPGNTVTLEQALANDDVQILAEEWVARSDIWKRAAAKGQVRAVGHPFTEAAEGWYVPSYVLETAPDLREVSQLADPRYVALFRDNEQPERGKFLNCPSGWTCESVNSAKLHAYGLDRLYADFRPGTGPAMDAAITAAYLQGSPLLFYYWSPSPIAGKFKLTRLAEPSYAPECWNDLTNSAGAHIQGCAAPEPEIGYGVSENFAREAPDIIELLSKATFPIATLNAELAAMVDSHNSADAQADAFLRYHPEIWRSWLSPAAAARLASALASDVRPAERSVSESFPSRWTISLHRPINEAVERLVSRHGGAFRRGAQAMLSLILLLDHALAAIPWWLLIAGFMGLAWAATRRIGLTAVIGLLLLVIGVLGLWESMLQSLSLMLVATVATLVSGLLAGVLCAKFRRVKAFILPVLDVMQTMPAFVYLIPALMLFGLGKVPAVLATIIYSLPPMIRLTALGVEQVDPEIKEAATSFGVTPLRLLLSVELPLALPTVMAGVNQTVMLALSMVVVASMIGARGLGEQVLNGIQNLDIGLGLEAGIGIVVLAFVLDRISQGFGRGRQDG